MQTTIPSFNKNQYLVLSDLMPDKDLVERFCPSPNENPDDYAVFVICTNNTPGYVQGEGGTFLFNLISNEIIATYNTSILMPEEIKFAKVIEKEDLNDIYAIKDLIHQFIHTNTENPVL